MHSNRCRMTTWGLALFIGGFFLAGLLGCCDRRPSLFFCCGHQTEKDYGRSVTHNLASQLVNPEAGKEVYVSRGQTPEAAYNAYEKYNKSFKPGEKPSVLKLTTGEGY